MCFYIKRLGNAYDSVTQALFRVDIAIPTTLVLLGICQRASPYSMSTIKGVSIMMANPKITCLHLISFIDLKMSTA